MDQFLWNVANVVDIVHLVVVMPLILSMIYFMARCKVYGQWVARAFVMSMLTLQATFLNCPLTMLSGWLRNFKVPGYYAYTTSLVHRLYEPLGPYVLLHWVLAASLAIATIVMIRYALRGWRVAHRKAG